MCMHSTFSNTRYASSDTSACERSGHSDEEVERAQSPARQSYLNASATWTKEGWRGGAAALRQDHVLAMRTSFATSQGRTSQTTT